MLNVAIPAAVNGAAREKSKVEPRYLNIDQAATYLSMSKHTLYGLVSQRRIPFIKKGEEAQVRPHGPR
jgi:excisionase family DNA binding protein